MHREAVVLIAMLVATSTATAQTDSAPQWPVDSRVRIRTTSNQTVVGQLAEVRGDTLVIRKEAALFRPWKRILADSARQIEISRDRYISAERVVGGALAGAAATVVMGFVMDAVMPDPCTGDGCEDSGPIDLDVTVLGAAAGAIGGAMYLADRWEEVPKPLRVSVAPARGQARVVFSLSFR